MPRNGPNSRTAPLTGSLALGIAIVLAGEAFLELVLPRLVSPFGWRPSPLAEVLSLTAISGLLFMLLVFRPLRRSIHEQQDADANALHDEAERFRLLSLATEDLVWESDPATNRVWIGGATVKFGFQAGVSEHDRYWWREQIHPDDRARILAAADRALDGHEPGWSAEYRFRRGDGTYVHVMGRAYVVRTADGRVRSMIGTATDVTEKHLAEEQLRASEAHFRVIADRTPAMIWLCGIDKGCIYVNRTWLDFTGRSFEQELGNGWAESIHPDDREACFRTFVPAEEARQPFSMEFRFRRHDGEYRWMASSGTPRFDADGAFAGYVGSCFDVTELKRAQAHLAAARDEAVRSAQLKAQFVANMSHEIRTPMNGVIGMTALLLETELTAEQREYADAVRSSGEALLSVVNDILDFSKIEAGKLELEAIDFDLRSTVEDVVCLLAERADAKGVELNCLVDENVPAVVAGDSGRVRQILTNLVGNAVKFTSEGEVVVRVGVVEENAAGALVRFEVADTGIGITDEAQHALFRPFAQADGTTARRYGGTGLGLAISKQLVDLMGGEIGVSSAPGSGSNFWFTSRLAVRSRIDPAVGTPEPELDGARVLCVDDNGTSRLAIARRLSAWGLVVDCVADGPSAIARLRVARDIGAPFDLALIDHAMPGMSGLDVTAAMKADPGLAQIPIVLMTSWAHRGEAAAARKAGAWGCLTKPVRRSNLHDGVALGLRSGGVVGAPGTARASSAGSAPASGALASAEPARGRVLVVEDNSVNQMLTVRLLQKLGYQSDVASDGRAALAAIERTQYDAVLMDCQMPEMDGYEATAEIRRREAGLRRISIVAMTASDLPMDRDRCLAAGMDGFVAKPLRPENLGAALERWARPPAPASTAASSAAANDRRSA